MLIHATITITGTGTARIACEARLRQRLSIHFLRDEVTEHHGAQALCYDLKMDGGIPFPLFVEASQEFPELEFAAEWVNVEAGRRGSATIVNGRLTGQQTDRIGVAAAGEHRVYVVIDVDGSLRVALTMLRAAHDEWRGYALTAVKDALLRIVRSAESDHLELYATEGAPEWAHAWHGNLRSQFTRDELKPPVAIDESVFAELDVLARDFVTGWIWFSSAPAEEIAIEKERYAQHGYTVSDANVRSVRLQRMKDASASSGGPLVYSTLPAEEEWVKELVLATWAKG